MFKVTKLFLLIFITACSGADKHNIASIPEASGISYCKDSNTLIVANDEGSFYELTTDGDIIFEHKLGNFDLEGVVCEKENLVFAVEKGEILIVPRVEPKTNLLKIKGIKFNKKNGIEGITKIGDFYYASIQEKKNIENAKILVLKIGKNYVKVVKIIKEKIIDTAGMEYHKKRLYILSDKKDKLYVYNLKNNQIERDIKLPKFAQEGITFDNSGNVFFADDNGAVFKYRKKELGL